MYKHTNPYKKIVHRNYVLKSPVDGYILRQEGVVEEDTPWTLPTGSLVTVYETQFHWIVERHTNHLPGYCGNVMFKATIPKPE